MTNSQINELKNLAIGITESVKYAAFYNAAIRNEVSFANRQMYLRSSMEELDAIRDLARQVLAMTADKEVSND